MMRMKRSDLEAKPNRELIDLLLQQAEQIERLEAELEQLRKELAGKTKPPTTSQNSSQPPSRDQKSNMPAERPKRRRGSPPGRRKFERPRVESPDQIVTLKPQQCGCCQADLSQEAGCLKATNQITELPPTPAQVIEVRQYQVVCPTCGHQAVAQPPVGLEMERTFGARLEATVVYYRQQQHLSYERTQATLQELYGVRISQGGIDRIMRRAAKRAAQAVALVASTLQQSPVIYSDETGCRVDGENWWQWVFCSTTAILHVIRFNRSSDVIEETMAEHTAEVWISDCWPAHLKAPAQARQLCLAHQLRNLQAVVEKLPQSWWARQVQVLFRAAIHLTHQDPERQTPHYQATCQRIERLFDRLLARPLTDPAAQKLQRRYIKYRAAVFLFLYRTDVNPTNNISEQHLRPAVIHRKVTGGFRSGWGAEGYAALKSLIDTAALSQLSAFSVIQKLFGIPAILTPCE